MVKKIIYILIVLVGLALGYYFFIQQPASRSADDDTLIATPTPTPTIIPRNDNQ